MNTWLRLMQKGRDQRGASAVEYGLLVALIASLIILTVWGFSSIVRNSYKHTCTTIVSAQTQAGQNPSSCVS